MRSTLSRMSARDAAGSCLEGTPTVLVDLILQAAFLYHSAKGPLDGQVARRCAAPARLAAGDPSGQRVKFRGKVNVAVRLGLAACDPAEQREGAQARLAQLCLVRTQCRNHTLGHMHGKHCST